MDPIADNSLDMAFWNTPFIGGSLDLEESASTRRSKTGANSLRRAFPLAMTPVGDRVWVAQVKGGHRLVRRLTDLGIVQGSEITVVSRGEGGSVIVGLQGCRIGLGAGMAHQVMVAPQQPEGTRVAPMPEPASLATANSAMTVTTLHLGTLAVGQSGRIRGYQHGGRAYRSKLLSMGLTPGTHFTVTRQAPLGDPIEIEVRGYKLSLRKGEAAALQVEVIGGAGVAESK
jgi:ferrous iron transport protein A